MSGMSSHTNVRDDWTFELKGLAGERKFLVAEGLPSEWMIESVMQGQTDITDKAINVGGDLEGIVITLTNRGAKMHGTVIDDRGKPVHDCSVLIFPEDPALGPPGMMWYVRVLRPTEAGVFSVDRLPAGNYMIAAVPVIDDGDEADPEVLEQLRSVAVRVPLRWGDTKELSLKVAAFERR